MAARKSSARKPKREKSEMLQNIKASMSVEKTRLDPEEQATSNIEIANNIAKVAVVLENLSNDQTDVLKDILKSLESIPENVGQSIEQSEQTLEKLVKVIVKLEKDAEEAEKKGDTKKAESLRGNITALRGEANKAMQGGALAAGPQTMGEGFANMLGVSPRELRGAGGGVGGFFKAFAGSMKNSALDAFTPRLNRPPTLEETLDKERNKGKVSGALGEARKAEIAERMQQVPEHLRVKVDPETGMRYRVGTKGTRINEFNKSGARNENFQFGTLGGLVDEETGEAYGYEEKKVKGSMKSGREGFGDADGVDEATDTSAQDILNKMDDINDTLREVVTAIEGIETGGGGGGLPNPFDLMRRGPRGGITPTPKGTPKPTKAPGRLGRLGSRAGGLLRGAGRVLGKVALPLAAGMAAYDAYQGATADPEATTGQKFRNAGRNVLSGLTFGLVDSVEEKMADGSYQGAQATTEPAMQPTIPAAAAGVAPAAVSRAAVPATLAASAASNTTQQPIINNIDNSSRVTAPPSTQQQPSSVVVTVRDTSSSHIRFNNRRMARVM